ncbi:4-hydroxy-tetrahydrodipicolinate reductase [Namhaeicola litoreus]|uniref:4-hydroxy-tetrahydrodipicolinate reductase n=1 Tax=Namhaeicola litoreus TaxID=1052145 RepID=A0ABW3Y449_9FLAO
MKIALLGYGKMGKVIERIALERGHEIVLKIDKDDRDYDIKGADVAIDFSVPSAAYSNLKKCIENGVPVVCGTTGWLDKYDDIVRFCQEKNGGLIYASNFSIGVNLFFKLNEYLAKLMNGIQGYDVYMEEIHHTQKLDAPSGTAITLAEQIIKNSNKTGWNIEVPVEEEIYIDVKRENEVPGTHTVTYKSNEDIISIQHKAQSREGFALGAVLSAEWLKGKKGVYSIQDVLNIEM